MKQSIQSTKILKLKKHDFSIVIPTIRYESIIIFLKEWEKEFSGAHVIVIEDNPEKSFNLPSWVEHFSWKEIDEDLGRKSRIISRRNAAIRCFGFIKAWQKKSKYILTLDDDCLPEKNYSNGGFLAQIHTALNSSYENDFWWNTMKGKIYPRGYPYNIRNLQKTVIHHGLWSNIPDLDGMTQKKLPNYRLKPFRGVMKVPHGQYFAMCSMNLVFKREILPAMFFPMMGQDANGKKWPYDRFDDIWAGILVKKVCDNMGLAISSGAPSVHHAKASNVEVNISKEKSGIPVNEWLWKEIESIKLSDSTIEENYFEIAQALSKKDGYLKTLGENMQIWLKLLKYYDKV